jgi:hypothetical protein
MKKQILISAICIALIGKTGSSQNLNNLLNQGSNFLNGSGQTVSNDEVVKGLKEALTIGTNNSTTVAAKPDGFFKNPLIKIPFPPDAKKMDTELRKIGMGKDVDKFVMTLNHGAEEAAKSAAPIFVAAITGMTITDGISLLKGGDNAATNYLKDKTSADLKVKFKPIIQAALKKVEITKYWNPLVKSYNKIPFVEKVNPNLDDYCTLKAMDGLFKLIAGEELKIRKDPAARVTDLLKKIFG